VTSAVPRLLGQPAWPAVPRSLEDLQVPHSVIGDIILRALWQQGVASVTSLQKTLKLSFQIVENLLHQFRQQHLAEVKQTVGLNSTFALTNAGRVQAAARMEVCQYVGPAPVSLAQYARVVSAQAAVVDLNRERLHNAFEDLVLPDTLLDKLGTALIAHQSLFLHGGSGSGKTSIAQRLLRIFEDPVVIPYAVEVDGHIITILDRDVHRVTRYTGDNLDTRWVVCERPCVQVGGELSSAMLDLRRDEVTRVFVAPCQVKANNGILIIDDFGRQVIAPNELLNRWIVPLDQHIDNLTLASGTKFQMPFELMLVLSSNLEPSDLVDEAFLRRVHAKVCVPDVSDENFDRIFERLLETEQVTCDEGAAQHLRVRCLEAGSGILRACYPGDIFKLIRAISKYEGHSVTITTSNIDLAVDLYFAKAK
jgi:predicted ATPase with chaperone activity